jgi:hypothetical protein
MIAKCFCLLKYGLCFDCVCRYAIPDSLSYFNLSNAHFLRLFLLFLIFYYQCTPISSFLWKIFLIQPRIIYLYERL